MTRAGLAAVALTVAACASNAPANSGNPARDGSRAQPGHATHRPWLRVTEPPGGIGLSFERFGGEKEVSPVAVFEHSAEKSL